MEIHVPSDEARTRRIDEIRCALQQENLDQLRKTLQLALSEYPGDAEVESFQHQLFQIEQASNVVDTLLKHGRRKIDHGHYEAGIAKLREALQIEPANREIPAVLFDALAEFAKITVERDSDLAQHLLQEAAELSPLNLRLESVRNHIADRIRQRTVDDGLTVVQRLRDKGQFREALKQVATLNKQLRPFHIPALEQMRLALLDDLGIEPRETVVRPADQTIAAPEAAAPVYSRSLHVREVFRKTWQNVAAAVGSTNIRKPLRETSQRLAATLRHSQMWALDRWSFTRGLFSRSPMAYPIAAAAACLVLVFATAMIGRSTGSKPKLVHVGTETILMPATLLPVPAANIEVADTLNAGAQIPERTLDTGTLVRADGTPKTDKANALPNSIRQTRTAIKKPAAAKVPRPHAVRTPRVDEQARIMRLANNAYSQKIYETAASYCTQVLKINPENVAARNLLATVRREQDNLVASIIKQ